jgi:hypothetical protein
MLEKYGWACNAGKFIPGYGRMARLDRGDGGRGKLVGMFFDTEIPEDEALRNSCWIIGLFRKETAYCMTLVAVLKAACVSLNLSLPDPWSEMDDLDKEPQVVVLVVRDKGEYFERMGVGIVSDGVWNELDIERKQFTLM